MLVEVGFCVGLRGSCPGDTRGEKKMVLLPTTVLEGK